MTRRLSHTERATWAERATYTVTDAPPPCREQHDRAGFDPDCRACRRRRTWLDGTRQQMIKDGTWRGRVDPGEARAHAARLYNKGRGLSLVRIADAAGVGLHTISDLLAGRRETIMADVSDAIRAIPVPDFPPPPAGYTYPHGSLRRLDGLAREGWTVETLAARSGIPKGTLREVRRRTYILQSNADKIAAMTEELAGVGGPSRITAIRCAGRPSLDAWGDEIDDPAAEPWGGEEAAVDGRGRLRDDGIVDEVTVKLLTAAADGWDGVRRRFSLPERDEIVRRGSIPHPHGPGLSATALGERLSTTDRTVQRIRARWIMYRVALDVHPDIDDMTPDAVGHALAVLADGPPDGPPPTVVPCTCGRPYLAHLVVLPDDCTGYCADPVDDLVWTIVRRHGVWPTVPVERGPDQDRHLTRLIEMEGRRLPTSHTSRRRTVAQTYRSTTPDTVLPAPDAPCNLTATPGELDARAAA